MNFDTAIEAEAGSTTTETTSDDNDNEEISIPFEQNEGTEGYGLFSESSSLVEAISTEIYGNDPVYPYLEWGDSLEDLEEAGSIKDFCDGDELTGQQKISLLHKLAKGSFGAIQSHKNEGYGMGWNTDGEGAPTIYDAEKVDHVPYFDDAVYGDSFEAFDSDTLTADEVAKIEEQGLDIEDFGMFDHVEGPVLPKLDGERVPILYENGDEVQKMLKMFSNIDWDEVTYCPKDGELQGTPSLGPDSDDEEIEVTTEDDSDDSDDGVFNLAANPARVNEVNVSDLCGQGPEAFNVSKIDSLRTLKTMLRVEKQSDSTRKRAVQRLEERINAVEGSEDEANDEEEADEGSDEEYTLEEVVEAFDLSDLEKDAVQHRVEAGKNEDFREAAKALQ